MPENKGLRYNKGKRKWSYISFKALEPMIEVLEFGAVKYEPLNWQKGMDKKELLELSNKQSDMLNILSL